MSKRRKKKESTRTPDPSLPEQRYPRLGAMVVVGLLTISLGVWIWKSTQPAQQPSPAFSSEPNGTNAAASSSETRPEFAKLKGRWVRPDGGYVLEISAIDSGGTMTAGYFNPQSIHVAKAVALTRDRATQVYVELRDVNYPGSTYTLTYDPQSDQLHGIYFQAVSQEQFEIYFERLK